jgi:hypothetical protein
MQLHAATLRRCTDGLARDAVACCDVAQLQRCANCEGLLYAVLTLATRTVQRLTSAEQHRIELENNLQDLLVSIQLSLTNRENSSQDLSIQLSLTNHENDSQDLSIQLSLTNRETTHRTYLFNSPS